MRPLPRGECSADPRTTRCQFGFGESCCDEVVWQFAVERPDFYRLFLALSAAPPGTDAAEVIRPLRQQLWSQLRDLFGVAAHHHGAFRGRRDTLAHTFLGMVHTWVGLFLAGDAVLDAPTRYRAVHGYLHGIFS